MRDLLFRAYSTNNPVCDIPGMGLKVFCNMLNYYTLQLVMAEFGRYISKTRSSLSIEARLVVSLN